MASVNWQPGTHPSIPNAAWSLILAANGARKAYTIINEELDGGNVFRIARQGVPPDQRAAIDDIVLSGVKQNVGGITLDGTDPVLVEIEDHGYETGDKLTFLAVGGTTELNGHEYTITVADEDTFTLDGTDSSAFTPYTSGGTVHVAAPVLVEIAEHGFSTDDVVYFVSVGGTTELNGNSYTITKVDANTFTLNSTDSVDFSAWTTGGEAYIPDATAGFALNPSGTVQCDYDAVDRGAVYAYQASGGAIATLFVQEAN